MLSAPSCISFSPHQERMFPPAVQSRVDHCLFQGPPFRQFTPKGDSEICEATELITKPRLKIKTLRQTQMQASAGNTWHLDLQLQVERWNWLHLPGQPGWGPASFLQTCILTDKFWHQQNKMSKTIGMSKYKWQMLEVKKCHHSTGNNNIFLRLQRI